MTYRCVFLKQIAEFQERSRVMRSLISEKARMT